MTESTNYEEFDEAEEEISNVMDDGGININ